MKLDDPLRMRSMAGMVSELTVYLAVRNGQSSFSGGLRPSWSDGKNAILIVGICPRQTRTREILMPH